MLVGTLLIMGLYHLILYIYRRTERSSFWFGIVCLSMTIRLFVTGERLLIGLFPEVAWIFYLRLEYISLYVAVWTMGLFFKSLYPTEIPRRFTQFYTGITLFCTLLMLVLPAQFFTFIITPYEILMLAFGFFLTFFLIRAILNRRSRARLIVFGGFFIVAATINDILFHQFRIGIGYMASVGVFHFIYVQAVGKLKT